MLKVKPFVKWAGGKRQIIDKLKKYMPKKFNTYYEPFVGGGAVLFELAPKRAVINDWNEELMNVYRVMSDYDKYQKMCALLNKYERENSKEFYYKLRDKDKNKKSFARMSDYARAARTIYLNKTCFNGLYRVNSKNEFNVPYNGKDNINTYDGENLIAIHMYLTMNDIKIMNTDFEEAVETAEAGDFVYFDPPYDSINNSFTSYTDTGFGKEEQERLADIFKELDKKGVYVMLSNCNTPFIQNLYKDYHIHVIEAKRSINAKGNKRGNVEEVIITNYE
ncbi:MAG TPA: DNA adenine methylase [Candidatus Onthousia faecigallinarum]|nr:DNA adenine methylase [Candidatus Onthousia faecigallinarum]